MSDGTNKVKTPKTITIYLSYQNQGNHAYFDNICLVKDNAMSYTYDKDGKVISVVDNSKKQSTMEYNNSDLTKNIDAKGYAYEYSYDLNNNITQVVTKTTDKTVKNKFTFVEDNLLKTFALSTGKKVDYTYDGLNRLTKTSLTTSTDKPIDTTYTYFASKRGSGYTTTKLKSETINGEKYEYKYDAHSNITDVTKDGVSQYHYGYDMMNQLVSVDDKLNGKVYNYTYDAGGNLISETVTDSNGTTSNAYEYNNSNWGDVLTSYNGQNITYDEIGNPLTYRDGMSMTWKNGRQLTTLTNGDTSISYGYDSDSVRATKTVNGVKYTYAYLNGQLMYETRGDAKFYYSYDSNGILYNVRYTLTDGGTEYSYYYTHNSRGDIVGIYNGAGELKAHYEYDAWGNVISITDNNGNAITSPNHIGNLNPFRYRGYYQDTETGLYYLMSRYYDAVTHRFINADGYFQAGTSILDGNTFAYCANNPVSRADTGGDSWFSDIAATIVESALAAMAAICPWMGSNSSTSVSHTSETKLINSDYAPVNFRCGEKTTTNISTHTYSLGSPTVYYNQDLYSYSDNYGNRNSGITHTFGVKSLSLDISMSFGSDGVGFSYAKIDGDISMYISYKKCNNFVTETEVGFTKWDNSTGTTVYLGGSSNSVTSSMLMYAASSIPSIVGAGLVFKVLIPALGG